MTTNHWQAAVLSVALALVPVTVSAQTEKIRWLTDYREARLAAQKSGKVLVIDFGMNNCPWCDRLDQTTFRDPKVVQELRENCIVLKINATYQPTLAQSLKITRYPTIVFASSEGEILNTQKGYVDAAGFQALLKETFAAVEPKQPAPVVATKEKKPVRGTTVSITKPVKREPVIVAPPKEPEWIKEEYQKATLAMVDRDPGRALLSLRKILQAEPRGDTHPKADRLLQEIEEQAESQLAEAILMEAQNDLTTAIDLVQRVRRDFTGTLAAAKAEKKLESLQARLDDTSRKRLKDAQDLWTQAQRDYERGEYLTCMDRCERITSDYLDLGPGVEARKLLKKIKTDPRKMQRIMESLPNRYGMVYLAMAEMQMEKGNPQQAVYYLRRIIQAYPETPQAELAQVRLSQLEGPPSMISIPKSN